MAVKIWLKERILVVVGWLVGWLVVKEGVGS
jgi:hypothetical protein